MVKAVKQAACADHVVGVVQEIDIRTACQDGSSHLTAFQQRGTARIELTVDQRETGLGKSFLEPLKPFLGAEVVRHLRAKEGNALVASGNDRFGHLASGPMVGDADGMVYGVAVDIHDLDNRDSGLGEHGAGGGAVFQTGDDHSRRTPRQHFVDHAFFAVGQVVGDTNHGLQSGAFQRFRNSGHHFGEDHVGQRRNHDAHKVHPLGGQCPGDLVRDIAKGARGFEHLFPRRRRNIAPVAQDPAYGHFRNARGFGHVAKGQGMARLG